MMEILIKVLVIIPMALWIVTACLIRNSSRKLNNYYECTGTVVRLERKKPPFGAPPEWSGDRTSVIAYTINGTTYEFFTDYYSYSMKVGKRVRVMYSSDAFSKATVKTGLYMASIITGTMAVCFTIAYVVGLVLYSKIGL